MNKFLSLIVLLLSANMAKANGMEDLMFASGKIYNAIAVAFVVLIGIFLYLLKLDRKVSRIEKEIKE